VKRIVVNGYFVTLYSPSAEAFKTIKADFKDLKPRKFYKMVEELEDYLSEVDEEYRERNVAAASRSIYAQFTKAYRRDRKISFSPYPNRFINITNHIRTKLYEAINTHAIVIPVISSGHFKRNIYILPTANYDNFLKEVDNLNKELDNLREMIDEYHKKKYIDRILAILDKYGVKYTNKTVLIHNIYVDTMPIVLDPEVIEPYISRRAKREIERTKQKIISEAIKE